MKTIEINIRANNWKWEYEEQTFYIKEWNENKIFEFIKCFNVSSKEEFDKQIINNLEIWKQ